MVPLILGNLHIASALKLSLPGALFLWTYLRTVAEKFWWSSQRGCRLGKVSNKDNSFRVTSHPACPRSPQADPEGPAAPPASCANPTPEYEGACHVSYTPTIVPPIIPYILPIYGV